VCDDAAMNNATPFNCGIGPAFAVIGGKWKAAILWEMHAGARRPGELRRLLRGISEKVLLEQLRSLEADGLVRRTEFPSVPPHVEYAVTPLGESLNRAPGPLADWGERFERSRIAAAAHAAPPAAT
jgi:DNA-binding HxlR family transcriptional regulator